MAQKTKPFTVVRTPKIRDQDGNYVKRGQTANLTQELAEHYHALGYIQVSMKGLFDEKPEPAPAPAPRVEPSPDGAPSDDQSDDDLTDDEAGSDDEDEAGEDAEDDAGTGGPETSSKRALNRRRKRATS